MPSRNCRRAYNCGDNTTQHLDSNLKMKPASRKPHRKTRTGCSTCKRRKIKCDEQRPQCTNCIKHSVHCDYMISAAVAGAASPGASYQSGTNSASAPIPVPSPLSHQQLESHPPSLNMLDLELLHNFCTSTCLTLHQDVNLKDLWKINVPQLGFSYDFVMRGCLALSAAHIAHFIPDKREFYKNEATIQLQSGLQQAIALLPHTNEDNCEALWIFSSLTTFLTLATSRRSNEFLMVPEIVGGGWLELLKGAFTILGNGYKNLEFGFLGPMFRNARRRAELRVQLSYEFPIEEDPTQELRRYMSNSTLQGESYDVCMAAIEELRTSFALYYKGGGRHDSEAGDPFIWLSMVKDGYLDLVRQRCQEAIAIFTFFCVLLKATDYKWWTEGAAFHFLEQTYNTLDEDHRLWIRWPIEEIGWVPNQAMSHANSFANTPAHLSPLVPSHIDVDGKIHSAPSPYMSPHGPST